MLKRTLLMLLPAIFVCSAQANTVEFCPNPDELKNLKGILTLKTEAGEGEWLGALKNASSSVTSFDSAIFYSNDDKVDSVGRLRACTYKTSDNQLADVRYRPEVKPDIQIKLAYAPAWERKEGPFGSVYFECRVQDLQGCAFREAK